MNREIKFRGKCIDNGEWVYGDLINCIGGEKRIVFEAATGEMPFPVLEEKNHLVNSNTVGQFIGTIDKKDNQIFEGDIDRTGNVIEYVQDKSIFALCRNGRISSFPIFPKELEIIGNIHDNPELIQSP